MTNYREMSLVELVDAYNQMATTAAGQAAKAQPVQRFATKDAAVGRCERLASSIKAITEGWAAEKARTETPTKEKTQKMTTVNSSEPAKAASDLATAFGVRVGTNRDKMLAAFEAAGLGEQVPTHQILQAVYGNSDKAMKGAMMLVMQGLKDAIKAKNLPYEIKRDREDKENRFGLHATSN